MNEPPLFVYSAERRSLLVRGDLMDPPAPPGAYVGFPVERLWAQGWTFSEAWAREWLRPNLQSVSLDSNVARAAAMNNVARSFKR